MKCVCAHLGNKCVTSHRESVACSNCGDVNCLRITELHRYQASLKKRVIFHPLNSNEMVFLSLALALKEMPMPKLKKKKSQSQFSNMKSVKGLS